MAKLDADHAKAKGPKAKLAKDLAAKIGSEYEQIGRELRASGFKLQD